MSLEDLCRDVVLEIIQTEKILEPHYEVSSASNPGDGYLGIHAIVKIIGKNKTVDLFVKLAPADEEFRKQEEVRIGFLNECIFYETIVPTLKAFEEEKACKIKFTSIPKCYKIVNCEFKETIVLENILESGYRLVDRTSFMPQSHIEMILREFGHFHALCFALKDQRRTEFEMITRYVSHPFDTYANRDDFRRLFEYLVDGAKKSLDPVGDEAVLDVFDKFCEEIIPFILHSGELSTDKYSIISHTDGWCNNFMFKYEDPENPTKPTKMHILDWQMMKICPPVFDISYFFYCSCGKTEMENLEYYLQFYHDSLSANIKMLGSDPEVLYPYVIFKEHWKKYSRYGLILALLVIKNMLTESDEVDRLDTMVTEGKKLCDAFMFKIKKNDIYKERIRDVILHFANNGFLDLLDLLA